MGGKKQKLNAKSAGKKRRTQRRADVKSRLDANVGKAAL
jgi:hypothetical protein